MKRAALPRLALAALSGAALAATPIGLAYAQDANAPLTVAIDASVCGQATITYTSTNTLPYSGDYRVDDEPGVDDEFSGDEVTEGPFAGELFGPRFHPVSIPAGATVPVVVEFGEDQGGGQVEVAAWVNRGPEQKAYAATVTAVVATDCEGAPSPTTPPDLNPCEINTFPPSAAFVAGLETLTPGQAQAQVNLLGDNGIVLLDADLTTRTLDVAPNIEPFLVIAVDRFINENCDPPATDPDEAPADAFDCADFPLTDGRTAQDVIDTDPTDPNRLDLDGDGDACELDNTTGADTDDDGGDFDQVGTPPAGGVATGG